MNYPAQEAIAVNPKPEYNLIELTQNKFVVNFKKIKNENYLIDFETNTFIFSEQIKNIFDNYCPHISYDIHINEKNKKKYYIPININELIDPMIIVNAESIDESQIDKYKGFYFPKNTDGLIKLTEKNLAQINSENFCISSTFKYGLNIYKQLNKNIFVSGRLGLELIKNIGDYSLAYGYPLDII